jgi:hypothetical protein
METTVFGRTSGQRGWLAVKRTMLDQWIILSAVLSTGSKGYVQDGR